MFPWPKEIKGALTNPFASMITSSSLSLGPTIGNEVVPSLNIHGLASNMDKEIVIHFNNVRQPIMVDKKVYIRGDMCIFLHDFSLVVYAYLVSFMRFL